MTKIYFLGEARNQVSDLLVELGGKAQVLDELLRGGFSVPRGFVLTQDVALDALSDAELCDAVARIGGFPVAVRSSGTLEDLASASFAGQYVTFLEVPDGATMRQRITDCRKSVHSPQVQAYLTAKKLDPAQARMSVLVQKMVDARTAGVCFTIHPITGREDHALIECCDGLGEKLVSGRISPSRYVALLRDGTIVSEEVAPDAVADARLSAQNLRELVCQSLLLQGHYGRPQDIEWAIDKAGALWLLQSRPVTTVQWRSDIEEYTNADFKDGGVSARVCSPLMYSLYRDAFQASMPAYLKAIKLIPKSSNETYIDCFYGRPYWNSSAIKRALTKVPGFDEKSFDQNLGIQKDYGKAGPVRIPTNIKTILPALPVAVALEKNYKSQLQLARAYGGPFLKTESGFLAKLDSIAKAEDRVFFQLFQDVLDLHQQTEFDYFTTIYNNSNAQDDFKKAVDKISKVIGREVSLVKLMAGLSDVSHMKIQEGLVALHAVAAANGTHGAKWDKALAEFLAANYFHGDSELDLTVPRWGEVPERVRTIISEMQSSRHLLRDPAATIQTQRQVYEIEKREVLALLDQKWSAKIMNRGGFLKQLERSRAYLVEREAMREFSTRSYHLVRRYALEAGVRWQRLGLIESRDDVFMTQTEEFRAWHAGTAGTEQVRENVAHRKMMYRGFRNFTPPDELGGGVTQRSAESYLDASGGKQILRGTGCSPGVVEGLVRMVAELADAGQLQKGEILVTKFTDPGWTPVLGVASGVVTEVGGLLSHAAVIGREYGIPAVLNIRGVTQALKTGQRVRVDGQAGTVEVLGD
ncbi:MAG: hypothetical protein HY074_01740 [Deltaproteobacteria bacterium]|nr:hypothetical protein [Deltaproteobacteria bacterium]